MIRVIIADDHPIVRHGLGRLVDLEHDMTLVAEAADGAALIEILGQTACDVLILDLSLPHLRGLELLAAIKERWPTLAVLIFSVHPEDNFSLYLMDAGAAGYLAKDRGIEQVLAAIRRVASGRPFITDHLAELRPRRGSDALAPHQRLSVREHQVFTRMIQGMNISAIAAELEINASTASNHVSRIRDKLGVESNGEILIYAVRAGLI